MHGVALPQEPETLYLRYTCNVHYTKDMLLGDWVGRLNEIVSLSCSNVLHVVATVCKCEVRSCNWQSAHVW